MKTITAYYDLEADILSSSLGGPALQELAGKLGDRVKFRLQFHTAGTAELLESTAVLVLAAKLKTDLQGAALILVESGDWTVPADASGFYEAETILNATELAAEFQTDEEELELALEVSYQDAPGEEPSSSQTIACRVAQDVIKGNEAPPASTGSAWDTADARYLRWLSEVTALTGGGSAALDGLATSATAVGALVSFAISAQFQIWQLQATSTAEDAANGIVRPDDYNASTNMKTWIRIL